MTFSCDSRLKSKAAFSAKNKKVIMNWLSRRFYLFDLAQKTVLRDFVFTNRYFIVFLERFIVSLA